MKGKITVLFFFLLLPTLLFAGTVGKIKGKVTDLKTGEPLIGASVTVVGTSLGAITGVNGEYVILNLFAGTYQLKTSYIGYQAITVSNVRVNSDLTTELNFELPVEGVQISEISVVASRPLINKNNTNANRITTGEDISALPVRGVDNIIALTPGVVLQDKTVFIRGGRQDEVGFYLEGASISDPVVGGRAVTLVQDAVEEIQVQAGGYTAEFGGANAGIIRQSIKSGTSDLKATAEFITDNISAKPKGDSHDGKKRLGSYWYGYDEFTASISGPVLDKRLKFFGLFNHNYQTDANPQSYPGINLGVVKDPLTGDSVNLNYPAGAIYKNSNEQYTGTGSFTLDFNPVIIRLVGTYTHNKYFNPFSSARTVGNIANIMDLDRTEEVSSNDGAFNLKATHMLSPKSYYEINIGYSYNSLKRYDPYLKDNFLSYGDSAANAAVGFSNFASTYLRPTQVSLYDFAFNRNGDVLAGYQKMRREDFTINAAFSTEYKEHSIKIGGEYKRFTIRNYSLGNEALMALPGLIHQNDILAANDPQKVALADIIINRGVNNYGYDVFGNETNDDGLTGPKKPVFASFYVQDKIEYKDLVINAGLRYDYIDIDNKAFADETYPDGAINKNTGAINADGLKDVPSFSAVSPRLGFSFPVTDQTVFHAQFGKFVQQSRLRDVYQGIYATAYNLRGGFEITAPVGYNIRPTRTTQYEVGFTQQIGDFASFDVTGYYKDIQDQVVYDLVKVRTDSKFGAYAVLKNGDFATTKGVEIAFNMRRRDRFQANATISFQDAQGTGSFPNSQRGIVGAPLDGVTVFKPQYISPLEYNNAFRGSINLDYRFGKDDGPKALEQLGISALLTFNSGHPYTLGIGGADLEGDARDRQPIEALNSSTTPWIFQVDLRIDKTFNLYDKLNANVYIYVINLFDRKNIENVFLRTGSTTDDGYLTNPTLGGKQVDTYGEQYAQLYRAINIDYYEKWQSATTGAPYTTTPYFYGPPRQIRFGIRLEY